MKRALFFAGVVGAIVLLGALTWMALAPDRGGVLPNGAASPAVAGVADRTVDASPESPAGGDSEPDGPVRSDPPEPVTAEPEGTLPSNAPEPVTAEPVRTPPRRPEPVQPGRARVRKPKPQPAHRPIEAASAARALRIEAAETASPSEAEALLAQATELERMLAPFVGPLVEGDVDGALALAVLAADRALADRFAVPDDAVAVDGARWRAGDPLPEHVILRFPAGRTPFDPGGIAQSEPPPKTVLVEGAGMDATALTVGDRWKARKETRWTFRDCTVACDSHEFVDGGRVEVRLERVRVVGFDSGAGGSEMYEADGLLVAVDCRFEQGFGRSPGYSNLFEGNRLFVRLDGCTFVGPFRDFNRKSTLLATDCAFEWAGRDFAEEFENSESVAHELAAHGGKLGQRTTFVDCVVASVFDGKRWPRRKLSDLDPDWTPDR